MLPSSSSNALKPGSRPGAGATAVVEAADRDAGTARQAKEKSRWCPVLEQPVGTSVPNPKSQKRNTELIFHWRIDWLGLRCVYTCKNGELSFFCLARNNFHSLPVYLAVNQNQTINQQPSPEESICPSSLKPV